MTTTFNPSLHVWRMLYHIPRHCIQCHFLPPFVSLPTSCVYKNKRCVSRRLPINQLTTRRFLYLQHASSRPSEIGFPLCSRTSLRWACVCLCVQGMTNSLTLMLTLSIQQQGLCDEYKSPRLAKDGGGGGGAWLHTCTHMHKHTRAANIRWWQRDTTHEEEIKWGTGHLLAAHEINTYTHTHIPGLRRDGCSSSHTCSVSIFVQRNDRRPHLATRD